MTNHEMGDDAEPIVENPDRPAMDAGPAPTPEMAMGAGAAGGATMEPLVDTSKPSMDPVGAPPSTSAAGPTNAGQIGDSADGYVRLVMDYRDGQLSAVSATLVPGRLDKAELGGQWAYQVLVDGRAVSVGGLPDLLLERGLAPRDNPEQGHATVPRTAADFVVRIPKQEVTIEDLERLTIELTEREGVSTPPGVGVTVQEHAAAAGEPIPQTLAVMDGLDLTTLEPGEARRLEEGLGQ